MWIVRLALRRPYTFVIMALLITILGGVSIVTMPVDIFPYIDIPILSVIYQYNGLSPEEMANRVVTQFERGVTTSVSRTADAASGSLSIGILRNPANGAIGEGVFATLRFKAVASGDAQVRVVRINPLGIDRIIEAPALPPPVSVWIK